MKGILAVTYERDFDSHLRTCHNEHIYMLYNTDHNTDP